MKKYLLLLAFFWVAGQISADPIQMKRTDVGNVGLGGHQHVPTILPTVDYTDGILTVQSSIPLSDVTVIIRGEEGAVLYTYFISIIYGTCCFSLPSAILNDMYSIELFYGSFHLIGYF